MPSLLDMPGEVRNVIYELVLTAPTGLHVRWKATRNRHNKKPVMYVVEAQTGEKLYPVNELQYVCKVFRKETAGLEIRFNEIIFTSTSHKVPGAMWGFENFLQTCTASKLRWIQRVVLKEELYATEKTNGLMRSMTTPWHFLCQWVVGHCAQILRLVEFCEKNPKAKVLLYLPEFRVDWWLPAYDAFVAPSTGTQHPFLSLGYR